MFQRRRRGHYDQGSFNIGIRTPSASAAAANAFYTRQLGPNAAAEALRRHSLDNAGANAMRDFGTSGAAPAPAPVSNTRRANSLTTRSYQVVHAQPRASVQQQRAGAGTSGPRRTSSFSSYTGGFQGLGGGSLASPRRNSLTNGVCTNSLTRTTSTVNRDTQGRTLSLTTTTVRQMGSFELVSTKEIPIGAGAGNASRLSRPQPSFGQEFSGAEPIYSLYSELHDIQEEDEENEAIHGSAQFRRLQRQRLLEEQEEEDRAEQAEQERLRRLQRLQDQQFEQQQRRQQQQAQQQAQRGSSAAVEKHPSTSAELARPSVAERTSSAELGEPIEMGDDVEIDLGSVVEKDDIESDGTVSDATPSPVGIPSKCEKQTDDLAQPALGEQLHREVSSVRSALKNGSATGTKTKVSFGGADEPYVYESYEYEDEEIQKQQLLRQHSPGIAAAAAASTPGLAAAHVASARSNTRAVAAHPQPTTLRSAATTPASLLGVNKRTQQHAASKRAAAAAVTTAQPTAQPVAARGGVSAPSAPQATVQTPTAATPTATTSKLTTPTSQTFTPPNSSSGLGEASTVAHRPSSGLTSSKPSPGGRKNSLPLSAAPYPHCRPWETTEFEDAPNHFEIPARSTARASPARSPVISMPSQFVPCSARSRTAPAPAATSTAPPAFPSQNGYEFEYEDEPEEPQLDENGLDERAIRAQALAMLQQQESFTQQAHQQFADTVASKASGHQYHALADDADAASIHSSSSFSRERRGPARGANSNLARNNGPSRMQSLRKTSTLRMTSTPTLRTGGAPKKGGRTGSLLNQPASNLDPSCIAASQNYSAPNYQNFQHMQHVQNAPNVHNTLSSGEFRTFSFRNSNRPDPNPFLSGSLSNHQHESHSNGRNMFKSRFADSDSEDEGGKKLFGGFGGSNGNSESNGSASKRNGNKMSFGAVFSPSTDIKDLFKSRTASEAMEIPEPMEPKMKKGGFFKRVFGKKPE